MVLRGSDCHQCHHCHPIRLYLVRNALDAAYWKSETTAQPQPKLGELISTLTLKPNPQPLPIT